MIYYLRCLLWCSWRCQHFLKPVHTYPTWQFSPWVCVLLPELVCHEPTMSISQWVQALLCRLKWTQSTNSLYKCCNNTLFSDVFILHHKNLYSIGEKNDKLQPAHTPLISVLLYVTCDTTLIPKKDAMLFKTNKITCESFANSWHNDIKSVKNSSKTIYLVSYFINFIDFCKYKLIGYECQTHGCNKDYHMSSGTLCN